MKYPMRRSQWEIEDRDEIKKILRSSQYVTIAMCNDNWPYIVTVNHAYDENRNCLYFHSAKEGKKIDYMESNGLVWGQVLEDYGYLQGECNYLYASVHFSGRVSFIEKIEEKICALKMMIEKFDQDPETTTLKHLTEDCMRRTAIGRIDIEYMTGKRSEKLT